MKRRRLWYVAAVLGIVCLLAMFKPGYVHDPATPEEDRVRVYLGLPDSPWFQYEKVHIDKRTESSTGMITRTYSNRADWHVNAQSESMLLPFAGIGFLLVAWRLKRLPR